MAFSADPVRWRLLSDNIAYPGPRLQTGVTYSWEAATNDPVDQSGRRLLDGDQPWDWTSTAGWTNRDNAVIFDFKAPYAFKKARAFFFQRLPASVECLGAAQPEGPWASLGALEEFKEGWNELPLTGAPARYVKMVVKMKAVGVYFREAQFIGLKPGEDTLTAPRANTRGGAVYLAEGGKPFCSVVVDPAAGEKVVAAAWLLRDTLERMTGAPIPLFDVKEKPGGARLLVGDTPQTRALQLSVAQAYPGKETYRITSKGADLVLAGNDAGAYQGTRAAVCEFLRRQGCGWYGTEALWQVVPSRPSLSIRPLDLSVTPPIALRSIWYVPAEVGKFWGLQGDVVQSHHNLSNIVTADMFAAHPEYFPMIDGKRTNQGEIQVCTTNPDVIRMTVEAARKAFDSNPELVAYSLSNNDCGGFCTCPDCAKVRGTAGNPNANAMLTFANAVVTELRNTHPAARVCFLAYWYTFWAPDPALKAAPGVVLMQVNEGCHAHALEDPACERNVRYSANFEKWADTGAEMAIYEWYIPGCSDKRWNALPWVAGETALRDLRWWTQRGMKWITYESQAGMSTALPQAWPLYLVAARGMWQPELKAADILRESCGQLYGPAAPFMLAYYQELERALADGDQHAGIWNLPDPTKVYTPEVQARCHVFLLQAMQAVDGAADPACAQRIKAVTDYWTAAEAVLKKK
ncbi:MAG: DUF4838 domain-containing protein [Armatimonadota bacterium]